MCLKVSSRVCLAGYPAVCYRPPCRFPCGHRAIIHQPLGCRQLRQRGGCHFCTGDYILLVGQGGQHWEAGMGSRLCTGLLLHGGCMGWLRVHHQHHSHLRVAHGRDWALFSSLVRAWLCWLAQVLALMPSVSSCVSPACPLCIAFASCCRDCARLAGM